MQLIAQKNLQEGEIFSEQGMVVGTSWRMYFLQDY